MDALAGLLDGPRARHAFLVKAVMSPPWSIEIRDRAPLSLVAMLHGSASMTFHDGAQIDVHPGDVAIVRGPHPYHFSDAPGTPTQIVIHPGQRCATVDGRDLKQAMLQGVRTWGNDPEGPTAMLIGTYEHVSELGERLLAALPDGMVVPRQAVPVALVDILDAEMVRDEPGQQVVLDRLLDLILIGVVRAWLTEAGDAAPGWYRAAGDPVVGPALRLLQHNPAHAWTVDDLADEVGSSRATLARRFTDLVGEPPMAFLTQQRLALAADLLLEPDATVSAVANKVGYATPFAFSTAFKRVRGVSPKQFRERHGGDVLVPRAAVTG
jgi:AraC-like DNA-binding protein